MLRLFLYNIGNRVIELAERSEMLPQEFVGLVKARWQR